MSNKINSITLDLDGIRLDIHTENDEALKTCLMQGVRQYNTQIAGESQSAGLMVIARDKQGAVIAGVAGRTVYRHFLIEVMWVDEPYRRQGLGQRVMQQAEILARQRDCVAAQVDTLSFQGPAFYAKLGFVCMGQIDDFPPGHKRYFLLKRYTNENLDMTLPVA